MSDVAKELSSRASRGGWGFAGDEGCSALGRGEGRGSAKAEDDRRENITTHEGKGEERKGKDDG